MASASDNEVVADSSMVTEYCTLMIVKESRFKNQDHDGVKQKVTICGDLLPFRYSVETTTRYLMAADRYYRTGISVRSRGDGQPKAPAALQAKASPIRSEKETEATKKARKQKKRLAESNKNDKRAISRPQGPTQPLPARWPDNDNDG